jgi:hypothetical protein
MAWVNVYAIPSPSIHYPQIGEDKKKRIVFYIGKKGRLLREKLVRDWQIGRQRLCFVYDRCWFGLMKGISWAIRA